MSICGDRSESATMAGTAIGRVADGGARCTQRIYQTTLLGWGGMQILRARRNHDRR